MNSCRLIKTFKIEDKFIVNWLSWLNSDRNRWLITYLKNIWAWMVESPIYTKSKSHMNRKLNPRADNPANNIKLLSSYLHSFHSFMHTCFPPSMTSLSPFSVRISISQIISNALLLFLLLFCFFGIYAANCLMKSSPLQFCNKSTFPTQRQRQVMEMLSWDFYFVNLCKSVDHKFNLKLIRFPFYAKLMGRCSAYRRESWNMNVLNIAVNYLNIWDAETN